jgi:hypothetical protein
MTDAERQDLAKARERADLARMRFANAFDGVLQRVSPERLRDDAMDAVADQFTQAKRDLLRSLRFWPIAVGALGAVLAMSFWRPARTAAGYALRLAELALAMKTLRRPKNE